MKKRNKIAIGFLLAILMGLVVPQNLSMPVLGASKSDFHPDSFWYYPWEKSITHKGVDVFAKVGTRINSATAGIVLYAGQISMGGNLVLVLGPKWRLH